MAPSFFRRPALFLCLVFPIGTSVLHFFVHPIERGAGENTRKDNVLKVFVQKYIRTSELMYKKAG